MEKLDIEIVPRGESWALVENGTEGPASYATREAAFEAVIGPASNALREGAAVSIDIRAVRGRT